MAPPTAAPRGPSIGIVGAGIGGLTLALACRHAGLEDLTVYEQADSPDALGAGIQLSPNASRVLHALGLKHELEAIASYPRAVHFRAWRSGYLIAMRPLAQFSEARYGAPYFHVHRADLHGLLLATAQDRGIRIEAGRRCTGVEQDARHAQLRFGDEIREHDLAVGCDGIHSAVRQSLFGDEAPHFTGHVAWRGLVPAARLPKGLIAPSATVWLGPARHFVHYYVRRGELVNFIGVVESSDWTSESWREPGDKAALAREFAGWHHTLGTLIDAADDVFKWALYVREPLPAWSRGRVTLLGDACHPMLPYLAQGAAMAMEDAWVLSRMLERWDDLPVEALAPYEHYRRPRTARVQRQSREQGEEFHLRERSAIWRRNLKLGIGTRFLPELAMSRFDWLHGYDCIGGFE